MSAAPDMAADLAAALDPARTFATAVGSDPEPWQSRVLRATADRQLLVCSRQVGKSTAASVKAAHVAQYEPGALVLVIAPTQRQADLLLSRVRLILRRVTKLTQVSTTSLTTEAGSQVVSLPGDAPDNIRGYAAARLLIVDEAARVSDAAWTAVAPMVGNGGQVLALTTPDARAGWCWEAWSADVPGWERVKVTAHESGLWSPERIAAKRRELSPHGFRCEIECEWVGAEHGLFDPDAVAAILCGAAPVLDGWRS